MILWSICFHLSHPSSHLSLLLFSYNSSVWLTVRLPWPGIVGFSNACDALLIGIVICCLQALAEALKHNKTLPKLDLATYGFGVAEVQAVFMRIEFWNMSCFRRLCCWTWIHMTDLVVFNIENCCPWFGFVEGSSCSHRVNGSFCWTCLLP